MVLAAIRHAQAFASVQTVLTFTSTCSTSARKPNLRELGYICQQFCHYKVLAMRKAASSVAVDTTSPTGSCVGTRIVLALMLAHLYYPASSSAVVLPESD